MRKVLAIVLAGGQGARLHPLTAHRCKPAVPFHGQHSIVDFVLSNLANSGLATVHLLVQYQAQSLIEHVERAWSVGPSLPGPIIEVVPPPMRDGPGCYLGTADAVRQNIALIEAMQPDVVAVFGADHVYRMDVRQMVDFHRAAGADVTVATLPVPLHQCRHFGIAQADPQHRIKGFVEKPLACDPVPGSRTHALASMGNYLFDAGVLLRQLRAMAEAATDFGQHVLPAMVKTHRVMAYDFTGNRVPGLGAHEEPAYWRDIGTVDAWFEAQFDTAGARPKFRMDNACWPIHTGADPAGAAQVEGGQIRRSVIGSGSVVDDARLDHVVLRSGVQLAPGAELERCIVLDRSRIGPGARLRRAIVAEDNEVPAGECIGFDPERDHARFPVTASGIVVVPAGTFLPRARMPLAGWGHDAGTRLALA